ASGTPARATPGAQRTTLAEAARGSGRRAEPRTARPLARVQTGTPRGPLEPVAPTARFDVEAWVLGGQLAARRRARARPRSKALHPRDGARHGPWSRASGGCPSILAAASSS